jgi:hypothetical protein
MATGNLLNAVQDGQSVTLDDTRWQQISLPHDGARKREFKSHTLASCRDILRGALDGTVNIDIQATQQGQKVYLISKGVYNRSEVFLNGQ